MTRKEALAILGLKDGASEGEIREVYHRLMLKIHPDKGGSAISPPSSTRHERPCSADRTELVPSSTSFRAKRTAA